MKYYSELQSISPRAELCGGLHDDSYVTKIAPGELMDKGFIAIEKLVAVELPEKQEVVEIHEMEASSAISERDVLGKEIAGWQLR